MLIRLLAAFILIPLVELFLLMQLAAATSIWITIALVIVTGTIGSLLARREGAAVWRRFRENAASAKLPAQEIGDGLMIAFAAALLLTPGVLTDVVGFALLTPAIRRHLRQRLASQVASQVAAGPVQVHTFGDQRGHAPRRTDPVTVDAVRVLPKSTASS